MNRIPSTPITASPLRTLAVSSSADPIRSAVLQFTVNALGIILIGAIYLNYVLLKSYFTPLFWGAMLSVPLHSMKRRLIATLFSGHISLMLLQKEKESLLGWIVALFKRLCQIVFGPFADVGLAVLTFYSHLVQRLTRSTHTEPDPGEESESCDNASESEEPMESGKRNLFSSHRKTRTFPPTPLRFVMKQAEGDSSQESQDENIQPVKTPSRTFNRQVASLSKRTPWTPSRRMTASVRSRLKRTPFSTRIRRKRPESTLFEPFFKLSQRWRRHIRKLSHPIVGSESPTTFLAKLAHNYHVLSHSTPIPSQTQSSSSSSSSRSSVSSSKCIETPVEPARSTRSPYSQVDHLWILILWAFRYSFFLVLKHVASTLTLMDWLKPLFITATLHLLYHLLLSLIHSYSRSNYKPFGLPSIKTVTHSLASLSHVASRSMKQVMAQHMNGFMSLLLIVSSILFTTSTTTLLLFKVVQEGALIIDSAIVPALNHTLIQNQELKQHVEQAVITLRSNALDFLDSRLLENYPGLNVTARDVYDRVWAQFNVSRPSKPIQQVTQTSQDHLWMGSCLVMEYSYCVSLCACPLSHVTHTSRAVTFMLPSNEHPHYTESEFPVTARLLRKLSRGKLKSCIRLSVPAFDELRTKCVSMLQPLFFIPKNDTESYAHPDVLKAVSSAGAMSAGYVFNISMYILALVISAMVNAFDLVFKATLFFASLYTCLVDEKGIIYKLSRILVVLDPKEKLRMQLEHGVKSALIVNVKLMLYHLVFTWLTYHAAGCELVYIPTFIAGFLSLIPLISPLYVFIPGSISLFLRWRAPWGMVWAIVFFIAHAFVALVIDSQIVESEMVMQKKDSLFGSMDHSSPSSSHETLNKHQVSSRPSALITGLAFWLGYWNFGGMEGLVLGPILVSCVPILVHHFYGEIVATLL